MPAAGPAGRRILLYESVQILKIPVGVGLQAAALPWKELTEALPPIAIQPCPHAAGLPSHLRDDRIMMNRGILFALLALCVASALAVKGA